MSIDKPEQTDCWTSIYAAYICLSNKCKCQKQKDTGTEELTIRYAQKTMKSIKTSANIAESEQSSHTPSRSHQRYVETIF